MTRMLIRAVATGAAVDAGELIDRDDIGVWIRSDWYRDTGQHRYSLSDFTAVEITTGADPS